MRNIDQLKRGIARAWDTVADGWREFATRAGDALTRFNPVHRNNELEARDEEQHVAAGARWGVLAAELAVYDDTVEATLEVPGMDADAFTIEVVHDVLIVRGEKRVERNSKRGQFHVMERAYGSFERAFQLPVAVEDTAAKASYRRGVLRVVLPRAAHARPRRITVKAV